MRLPWRRKARPDAPPPDECGWRHPIDESRPRGYRSLRGRSWVTTAPVEASTAPHSLESGRNVVLAEGTLLRLDHSDRGRQADPTLPLDDWPWFGYHPFLVLDGEHAGECVEVSRHGLMSPPRMTDVPDGLAMAGRVPELAATVEALRALTPEQRVGFAIWCEQHAPAIPDRASVEWGEAYLDVSWAEELATDALEDSSAAGAPGVAYMRSYFDPQLNVAVPGPSRRRR